MQRLGEVVTRGGGGSCPTPARSSKEVEDSREMALFMTKVGERLSDVINLSGPNPLRQQGSVYTPW